MSEEKIEMFNFDTLYKKDSHGRLLEWAQSVYFNAIITEHGLSDRAKQKHVEEITQGKNIGRSNETTPSEQAMKEAHSRWTKKQSKEGYRISQVEAMSMDVKESLEGGFSPMLAHDRKHLHKIVFPCFGQPKLDGNRCIAMCKNGTISLFSRSGKKIITVPHIIEDLHRIGMKDEEIFDGELYNHSKLDFDDLSGCLRAGVNVDLSKTSLMEYHIYDFPRIWWVDELADEEIDYETRLTAWRHTHDICQGSSIQNVETVLINNEDEMKTFHLKCVEEGYEGSIFRNCDGKYVQKRSYDLIKYKDFVDDFFQICDIEDGRGKYKGIVARYICLIPEGMTITMDSSGATQRVPKDVLIEVTPKGRDFKQLKQIFENKESYIGKELKVFYQNVTPDFSLRFAKGREFKGD
jgi:DNA ligase-1